MNIRKATIEDIDEGYPMLSEFYTCAFEDMGLPFKPKYAKGITAKLIEEHIVLVAEGDEGLCGCIGLSIQSYEFNEGEKMLYEMFWYVKPNSPPTIALKLIRKAEEIGKELGAKYMCLSSLGNRRDETIGRFYRKLGWKHFETTYIKTLGE